MRRIFAAIVLVLCAGLAATAIAQQLQETPEEERSMFLSYVEDSLSGPNRQIRISGIEGVLSSNATIGEITVADDEGVWLRITNAAIVWSRSALVFRQRLQIDSLAAQSIEVVRRPIPDESLPSPEASSFAIPQLPIAVNIDVLDIPRATFGRDVFGLEAELSLNGRIRLADGSLDTALDINRLDGAGGSLALAATYAADTERFEVDLNLSEPENGVVANLLNIEGRPPVDLEMKGAGPLGELDVTLALDAAGERVLSGTLQLRRNGDGLGYAATLQGPIAQLVPVQFRDFFGAETTLDARGTVQGGGGVVLDQLQVDSAALSLAASGETGADGFLRRVSLDARIGDPAGGTTVLPVAGGQTTVRSAEVTLSFGEGNAQEWSGLVSVDGLVTTAFSAQSGRFTLGGLAEALDRPADRSITFAVNGSLDGIVATRADVAEALGDSVALQVDGSWASGQPIRLDRATLNANSLTASMAGTIAELTFDGEIALRTASVAPFSGLAGRDLSGGIDLRANGTVSPASGGFDLVIDSTASDLRVGNDAADRLLAGSATITGRVARNETGLVADGLRIGNERVALTADGNFGTGSADFEYALTLSDLALLSPQASGRLEAQGRAAGRDGLISLTTVARVASGRLLDRDLRDAQVTFEGTLQDGALDGTIGGDAFLDGTRAQLSAGIGIADGTARLTDLDFSAGGARARGTVSRGPTGMLDGSVTIEAADISTAAALFLVDAAGAIDATVTLAGTDGRQDATVEASIDRLRLPQASVERATVNLSAQDLFGVPAAQGTLAASGVVAGGLTFTTIEATAGQEGEATTFDARAGLQNGSTAVARGSLAPEDGGYRVRLDEASLGQGIVTARLVEPASLLVVGDTVAIDRLAIDVAGGRVVASGRAAETLDLQLAIERLPLSIANLVRPDLGLGGTVDGNVVVSGTRDTPDVTFELRGNAVEAAALRQVGQSSLTIAATGRTASGRLQVETTVTSPQGLRATARGTVPLDAGAIDLTVELAAFPLAALDRVVPGQGLGGTVTGTARIGGTVAAPQARFDLRGSALRAAPLQAAGIASLDATARGRFEGNRIVLEAASASGPQGLSLSGSGTIPLQGSGLAVNFTGTAPLSLANRLFADRGTQASGTVQLSGSVSGSLASPVISAMFSTTGAQLVDPETNLRLVGINVMGSVNGETLQIRSASATLATGGTVNASGTVSLNAAAGMPTDIRLNLDRARYADGNLVVATVSGALALTGPLMRDPLLSGRIDVHRAEIGVPETLAGGAAALDVIHVNPPPAVKETLQRARASDGTPMPSGRPSVMRLDVTVSASNQIFVRGRGIDAELGGEVRLTGPVTAIQPVGGFNLIRGRLSILGRRITFDEGLVTLVGDLDPFLNFVARSEANDITVFITVSGRISDLDIAFSSQPALPEDEVLARLIFRRGMDELSPIQIAQLAAAAAELAGGGNSSLLGSLRNATGLDDLELVTDSQGNPAVRAGRYIRDNIYLGIETGGRGSTRGTINLDITDDLKAKGSVGSDGDSSLGIFFERDY